MAKTVGLLSIDPGWRGLAFTLHLPAWNRTTTRLFQLNVDASKAYKRPANTIPLLVNAIREQYLREEPLVWFVDKIIIESQFRSNMQMLSYLIMCVFQTILPDAKVEMISALKCKRAFGIPLGDSHYENKKRMLEYVTDNKHNLIGGDTVTNHDTADSVILLNTYLKEKKRRLETNIENLVTEMDGYLLKCPKCSGKAHCNVVKKPGKNQGKYFLSCDAYKTGDKCEFKWLGYTEPELVECDDGTQYVADWEVWSDTVGEKRRQLPTKPKPPPPKARALNTASKAVPTKAPAAQKEAVTRDELTKALADLARAITAHVDEKFRELQNVGDEDSGQEEGQIPEEIE